MTQVESIRDFSMIFEWELREGGSSFMWVTLGRLCRKLDREDDTDTRGQMWKERILRAGKSPVPSIPVVLWVCLHELVESFLLVCMHA